MQQEGLWATTDNNQIDVSEQQNAREKISQHLDRNLPRKDLQRLSRRRAITALFALDLPFLGSKELVDALVEPTKVNDSCLVFQ